MATYKAPGVYIEKISVFPPSIAEVETAVPAFIGYTEKAKRVTDDDLRLVPTKIYSMREYEQYFGMPQQDYGSTESTAFLADVSKDNTGAISKIKVHEPVLVYLLHYAMRMFFENGGSQCYIVSVGNYRTASPAINLHDGGLMDGLEVLKTEDEPTLIVIPEAIRLKNDADYETLVQAMLQQCSDLRDRFSVFDIRGGASTFVSNDASADSVATNNSQLRNRSLFGTSNLKYGAAYYPFIKTRLNYYVNQDVVNEHGEVTTKHESNIHVRINGAATVLLNTLEEDDDTTYNAVRAEIKNHYVILPPCSAVAGVYAATDRRRGVWKAPANVSLTNVIEPVVKIDNEDQANMNVDRTSGKSINAIRAFAGKGTLIWGSRTLAGNDNEWRYVPVQRFYMNVEESVIKSTSWVVFEPNDANTWVKVRGMIENYLTKKWREGALAGSSPRQAFYVRCGLGSTMDSQDILEGRMNVEIGFAVVRPAEFIIIKFSHMLQTP